MNYRKLNKIRVEREMKLRKLVKHNISYADEIELRKYNIKIRRK